MRAPPAVAVRCTGGWPWRLLNLALPALAAGVAAAWSLLHLGASPLPALALGLAVLLLLGRRWHARAQLLQWDGQRWTADGVPGRLQLMIDAGPWLLLRLHTVPGPAPWLAVTAAEAGAAWHGLRAAVYSRPSEITPGATLPDRTAD
ncbi:MAG: hypothetical protein C0505_17645 [Leptothrix sp. (in: Bacteria)]|nr:hypothetical protein [Leptothrix sp. (in: b-proteobacteria)]